MATTWIFQANPKRFNIDGFLSTRPATTTFLVTRYADRIATGDRVFIWRSAADDPNIKSGVIAEAEVLAPPMEQQDEEASRPYWLDGSEGTEAAMRVQLRVQRIAQKKEVIQRRWLSEDPVLRDLTILKMANATNYEVRPDLADRLSSLWLKTGSDWEYSESVAGLWAYHQTYAGEVSRLPGSVVAKTAVLIGRAVPGCYNKVMNFRHIDPRDVRQGLSGGGAMDAQVWATFYDEAAGTLRATELEAEYVRFWLPSSAPASLDVGSAAEATAEAEARKLSSLSLAELLARFEKVTRGRSTKPTVRTGKTRTFEREPLVVAIALVRAASQCEIVGCAHPQFEGRDGLPYCEVHHIHSLAEGGEDTPGNVACLCPAHHREVHFGTAGATLNDALRTLRNS